MEHLSPGDPERSVGPAVRRSGPGKRRREELERGKSTRRWFLLKTLAAVAGGLLAGTAPGRHSRQQRKPRVSWREAMHYAKRRKPAG